MSAIPQYLHRFNWVDLLSSTRLSVSAALAAILAFLAFRPRKGWLRQRATVGSSDNLDSGGSKLPPHTNIVVEGGDDDDHDLDSKGMPLVPPVDPTAFSALPVGSRDERAESNLPFSYVTTAGYAKPMFIPDASSGAPSTGRTPSGVLPSNLSDRYCTALGARLFGCPSLQNSGTPHSC